MCKYRLQFGLDIQCSALVLNFNNIFSNGHLYRAGQSMNSLPSQILIRYTQCAFWIFLVVWIDIFCFPPDIYSAPLPKLLHRPCCLPHFVPRHTGAYWPQLFAYRLPDNYTLRQVQIYLEVKWSKSLISWGIFTGDSFLLTLFAAFPHLDGDSSELSIIYPWKICVMPTNMRLAFLNLLA